MLSNEEKEPRCLCRTFRPGEPGMLENETSPVLEGGDVDDRLRLRFTVVKKPLFLRLFSCIELAGELSAGLSLIMGESSASTCSDWDELCRFHFKRSIVTSVLGDFQIFSSVASFRGNTL